jgi:hypothetical protein
MKPVSDPQRYGYEGRVITFTAPPGMDDCADAAAIMEPDGTILYVWELDLVECAALVDGARLELRLLTGGRAPVPVSLSVQGVGARVSVEEDRGE